LAKVLYPEDQIKLHQMHSRAPHFDKPDYIVYDFDPRENYYPSYGCYLQD
jgi:hypothetical protein